MKQFIKECEVLNKLDHPNVLKTYGFYFGDEEHESFLNIVNRI